MKLTIYNGTMVILIIVLVSICSITGCVHTQKSFNDTAKLYTAYNIWIHQKSRNMMCINYKAGMGRIPAGTEVRNVMIKGLEETDGSLACARSICFTTVRDGRKFYIRFNPRWHPGKTINDYKADMFSTKKFEELTHGMSEKEVKAIKQGVLIEGMNKQAVLCCYGPPPEHATISLDDNIWLYWVSRWKKKKVCFDENGNIMHCEQLMKSF